MGLGGSGGGGEEYWGGGEIMSRVGASLYGEKLPSFLFS